MNLLNTHTPRKTKIPKANNHEFTSKALWKAIIVRSTLKYPQRKKCPYSESYWSIFSRIRTDYGEIFLISPYSDRIRENTYQNNSEYGHFLRSDLFEKSKYY